MLRCAGGIAKTNDKIGEVVAGFALIVGVRNAEVEEVVFNPRDHAALSGEVVEDFGDLTLPTAVEHDEIHMAVVGGVGFLGSGAVDEAGAAGGIIVIENRADGLCTRDT